MRWQLHITGDSADLKEVARVLDDKDLRIAQRGDGFFLEGGLFDVTGDMSSVKKKADEVVQMLNGVAKLTLGSNKRIQLANDIARVREDGGRDIVVTVNEVIEIKTRVNPVLLHADGKVIVPASAAEPGRDWIKAAVTDPVVAKVLQMIGSGQLDWVSLYRILEVIEEAVGVSDQIVDKGWATKAMIKTFKHSANSPGAVGGDARHGREATDPPRKPMSLGEAKSLIEYIVKCWLRERSS